MVPEKFPTQEKTSEREKEPYTKKTTIYPWETTINQLEMLAQQRRREQPSDLLRLALSIGALFISIQGERGPDGNYGLWSAEFIQDTIRIWVLIGEDWLSENGHPLHKGGDASSVTALIELMMRGGFPLGGSSSTQNLYNEMRDRSLASGQESDPLSETPDFVLGAGIGADLNLEENDFL